MVSYLIEKLSVLLTGDISAHISEPDVAQQTQVQERRWAARSPLKIRVNLYRNGSLVRHSIASDFSLNGMFIRCHQADMRVGEEMALAIPDVYDGTEKWYPMQVKVSRIAESGIGMAFSHHNCESFCCISKLVHVQNVQKVASELLESSNTHAAA